MIIRECIRRTVGDWKRAKFIRNQYRYNLQYFTKDYAELCKKTVQLSAKNMKKDLYLAAVEEKDKYLDDYIRAVCDPVIQKYHTGFTPQSVSERDCIWVFWWTGEDTAPDLIKVCLKSIRANASGHPVIMIDQTNYAQFVQLPEHILEKHNRGLIGHAHFSDVLRHMLLAKYGGVWIDATVFLSQPLPDRVFQDQFYTFKSYDPKAIYPSKSRWCTYFLAGKPSFPLFAFTAECLIEYWKDHDAIIDYLLMDYVIRIAYEEIPAIGRYIDSLQDNNPMRTVLMDKIRSPYSKELFQELSSSDTFASKLSWRYGKPVLYTKNGELTNYGYLISLLSGE